MDITLISTTDIHGGAARAAYRLHKGLVHVGHNVTMLSRQKISSDPQVISVERDAGPDDLEREARISTFQKKAIDSERTVLSNTLFSMPYPGLDVSQLPIVREADVVNLHWVARFQSPSTLSRLLQLGKPVVWTLHDMWAFTGGCHYAAGCLRYQQNCAHCPQLAQNPYDATYTVLADKIQRLGEAPHLTIVTPSRWLAECVRSSQLFRHQRVEVIPYSLETDVFLPRSKADAKEQLGIASNVTTLLFGAVSANEDRKGFAELVQALWICMADPRFRQKAEAGRIEVLCFGAPSELLQSLGLPVRSLGRVDSDDMLSQIYSAADMFVLPSLEDNLPNTMLESMSCGTPVIGFDTGGIPDLVTHGLTGYLVPLRDSKKLAEMILDGVLDPDRLVQMGQQCRQMMEADYTLPIQANRYVELFQDLIQHGTGTHGETRASAVIIPTSRQSSAPAAFSSSDNESTTMTDDHVSEPMTAPLDTTLPSALAQTIDEVAFQAVVTQLQQTRDNFHDLQVQMKQKQTELGQVRAELKHCQELLQNTKIQLQSARLERDDVEVELRQAQIKLNNTQEAIARRERRIQEWRGRTATFKEQIREVNQSLESSRAQITEMESSKFWQLRNRWMALKQKLGIGQ